MKTRIMIVDDSVVARRILSDAIGAAEDLEIIGSAANGKIALAKLSRLDPQVVVLDVEMPEMDGLETLRELRKRSPSLPVIMFSSLTKRGAAATLDALSAGASDYCAKPSSANLTEAIAAIRAELLPKIRALAATSKGPVGPLETPNPTTLRLRRVAPPKVVAIGASTGGPNALAQIVSRLPSSFPVPVVVVQHMPPVFTRLLAERLSADAALPVTEAVDGERLLPGHVYLAPGDYHLEVTASGSTGRGLDPGAVPRIRLHQGPAENFCRPAVDVTFRSLARTFGPQTLAVVLTGMGRDGFDSSRAVREAGGFVLVQNEETSVVWGMPGLIARAGLADAVLDPVALAAELCRRAGCATTREPNASGPRRSSA